MPLALTQRKIHVLIILFTIEVVNDILMVQCPHYIQLSLNIGCQLKRHSFDSKLAILIFTLVYDSLIATYSEDAVFKNG
jgi:hypothetical protein